MGGAHLAAHRDRAVIAGWTVAAAMPLQRAVEQALDDPALAGASVSVVFGPPDDPVAAVDPDRRLVPASVTKLVTAAVVADALPLDTTFETRVFLGGDVADGVLAGDVWVVAGGDPSLGVPDPRGPPVGVARAVHDAGVRVITGGVVVDPTVFDGPPWGQGWMWDDLSAPWSPAVSGLSYARGLAVPGCAGQDGPGTPALDPATCFAQALHDALVDAGVQVSTPPVVEPSPPVGAPLVVLESPPLRELLGVMLQESDNLYAESLWRAADPAVPHTAAGAREQVAAHLAALGSPDRAPVDGSGLSRYSALSARTLARVAAWVDSRPWGPELAALLPVAGRTGTLSARFQGTPAVDHVVAKTGSMTGVRNLAGWVTTADGERWPFAVCLTGFVAPQGEVIAVQDRVVALAAASRRGRVSRRDVAALSPRRGASPAAAPPPAGAPSAPGAPTAAPPGPGAGR